MKERPNARYVALAVLALLIPSSTALAQTAPITEDRLRRLEETTALAQSSGDNTWMLTCAALVLMMTGPGLALFYGGLVRRTNVLATMMQSFTLMAVVTILWALYGYTLAFGTWNWFIGDLRYAFMHGVSAAP